jgi:hypothetical protein
MKFYKIIMLLHGSEAQTVWKHDHNYIYTAPVRVKESDSLR